jgi:hypothetical protein
MNKSQLTIKRAHVFLGGPYHGAVKLVREGQLTGLLPRRELPRVAYNDVRMHFASVMYVRETTAGGDVFVYSELGPKARAALIQEYRREQTSQNHDSR